MKALPPLFGAALAALALLAGCATTPPVPRITYPVTYQINVGNTQVTSNYGPQNLNINATQQVTVAPGQTLYYQVVSPVAVTLYVYEDGGVGSRTLLGQMSGTSFTSSIVPSASTLEFAFAASAPNSSGVAQFTLSDRPIAPNVAP